ncbi:MAG: ABC transporter ATP-binding protein [Acidobacteriota bacterium]
MAVFFWRYLRRYLGTGALAIFAILVFAVTTGTSAALIKPIFAEVLRTDEVPGFASLGDTDEEEDEKPGPFNVAGHFDEWYDNLKDDFGIDEGNVFIFLPLLFALVFILRNVANFVSGYSFQRIGLGVTTDIRNDLYEKILGQSSRFHSRHPSGELMARVVNDVSLMQNAVSNRLLDMIQQPLTLVVLTALLLSTHLSLGLVCLFVAPVLLYPIVRFGKGMRRTSHSSQERMADIASLMGEGVRGFRVVKSFGMEDFELERFERATNRHKRVNLRAQLLSNLSSPVVESLAVIGAAALLMWAGWKVYGGELEGSELVMFLTTLLWMYDPIRKLNKVNLILQEALAAGHRVSSLMATPNDIAERPDARDITRVEQGVTYEGVGFAYETQPVLEGVDLEIRRGEIVALVGSSGAGKSTMVNLLSRFFDPNEGRIAIDGIDLRDLRLESLRALIGVVTQETVLFNDTVRNNIAYGRQDLPVEAVREAAAAAYADGFISELPKGYDTVVGEGGMRLSGGQRQRLSIARALLKNAPILVLDEATSQLDSESEALVQKALYNLMEGRTTMVIAHRLSTVMRADRIVVMDAGRVIESGTHDELLALGGTYKRLYDLQFKA